eukprot:14923706-Ditylum_brightwellii.AAC.1
MEQYKYMKVPYTLVPDEIKQQYELETKVHDGHIYFEIRKGMYGLPQAGGIAHDQLVKHLAKHGYQPVQHTPGLWQHETRDITFHLIVDDFGIKYTNCDDVEHLITALRELYQITVDWDGKLFRVISLQWDYVNRTVDLSMPGYIEQALLKFQRSALHRPEDSLHNAAEPLYTRGLQYAPLPNNSPPLNQHHKHRIQQILGTLLF